MYTGVYSKVRQKTKNKTQTVYLSIVVGIRVVKGSIFVILPIIFMILGEHIQEVC